MQDAETVTLLTDLVTQGLIPLPAFMNAYDERRSVSRQSPQFATLAVTAGGELQAIPAAIERALQDGFFAALWAALLERSRGALFGNADVEKITEAATAQFVGTMQKVLKGTGFRRVATYPALMRAARATALVVVDGAQGRSYGTGFLVGPDLLLTAAHVVESLIQNGQAKPDSAGRLSIEFFNQLEAPGTWPIRVRAQEGWLAAMSPWNGTPPQLGAEDPNISPQSLDFVLIRLARQIGLELEYLDIRNPPEPNEKELLTIIGYPGGNDCLSDDDEILFYNPATFRIRHTTNAIAGMSGSPCLNRNGLAIAIHEGGVSGEKPYNRGVHLRPVRASLFRDGIDLLGTAPPLLWGLSDADTRRDWIAAGETLLAKTEAERQEWLRLIAPFNPATPEGAQTGDTFHPVFGRTKFQKWIDEALAAEGSPRIAMISGGRGVGKSFSLAILRARLRAARRALVTLLPAEIRVSSIAEVMSSIWGRLMQAAQPAAVGDGPRPVAGLVRRDILPPAFDDLRKLVTTGSGGLPSKQLWVAIDFGEESNLTPDMTPQWAQWLIDAEKESWLRVVLIGLSASRFNELAQGRKVMRDMLNEISFDELMECLASILKSVSPDAEASDYNDRIYSYWESVEPLSSREGRSVEAVRMTLELRNLFLGA